MICPQFIFLERCNVLDMFIVSVNVVAQRCVSSQITMERSSFFRGQTGSFE